MIDIDKFIEAIQIKWIKSLLQETEANWTLIPRFHYNNFGKNLIIFKMNVGQIKNLNKDLTKNVPEFYIELLKIGSNNKKQK